MSYESNRDADGRPAGAVAWSGDLRTASPKALDEHQNGLVTQLGNLTVKWVGDWQGSSAARWRASTPQERTDAQYDRWVNRLVDVRLEKERREELIGGPSEYVELLVSSDGDKPWNDADFEAGRANYVVELATRWASTDPLEQWVSAAPEGSPRSAGETVREYLAEHNPFPDGMPVEVERHDGPGWERAVIVERMSADEWRVEILGGTEVWCSHHELRPREEPAKRA